MRLAAVVLALLGAAGAAPQYDPFAGARHAGVNGARLAFVERGAGGTPLIFVHGSGADLRTWGYQLQYFGQSRRTIAYSRRFHHPNAPPDAAAVYSAAQQADDLAVFIGEVASGRADLVASSYGAVVALLTARDHPAMVRRLVLVEPVVFSMLTPDSAEAKQAAALDVARSQLLAGETETAMRTFLSALIAPGAFDLMAESTRAMLRDNLPELTAEARAPMVTMTPRYTCEDARRVAAPTLLIDGGASAAFLQAMTRAVGACIPGVTSRTVAGASHSVHAQQVQVFNELVRDFLDRD
jgi:pimeloyl-ACP methyl ester carboxylesterase